MNVHNIYSPANKVSIDETILAFTGKSTLKVYMKTKPHPNGVKLYMLVDQHGILLSFIIYKKEKLSIYDIFKQLLDRYKNRSLKIYADRWFGSQNAIKYCCDNGFKFLIAMQKNRGKELWEEMKKEALINGYSVRSLKDMPQVRVWFQ